MGRLGFSLSQIIEQCSLRTLRVAGPCMALLSEIIDNLPNKISQNGKDLTPEASMFGFLHTLILVGELWFVRLSWSKLCSLIRRKAKMRTTQVCLPFATLILEYCEASREELFELVDSISKVLYQEGRFTRGDLPRHGLYLKRHRMTTPLRCHTNQMIIPTLTWTQIFPCICRGQSGK